MKRFFQNQKNAIIGAAKTVSLVVLGVSLAIGLNYVAYAFSEPTQSPPLCTAGDPGCDAPLNVGGDDQTKKGNLTSSKSFVAGQMVSANSILTSEGYALLAKNPDPLISGKVGVGFTGISSLSRKFEVLASDDKVAKFSGPTSMLDISNTASDGMRLTTDATGWIGLRASSSAGEDDLFIGTNGGVGIGTISPTVKLDVAGNIHASSDICTDAGGGKCLSNLSVATAEPQGLICGWDPAGGGSVLPCKGVNPEQGCPGGYTRVTLSVDSGTLVSSFSGAQYITTHYTCVKL